MPWRSLASYGHEPTSPEFSLLPAVTGRGPLDPAGLAAVKDTARDGSDPGLRRLLPEVYRDAPGVFSMAGSRARHSPGRLVALDASIGARVGASPIAGST